jgi:hypothetical protein
MVSCNPHLPSQVGITLLYRMHIYNHSEFVAYDGFVFYNSRFELSKW